MNTFNIFSKVSLALATLITGVVVSAGMVHALPYTGSSTEASPVPAFDVYQPTAGNPLPAPAPSDGESDFFQGRVPVDGNQQDVKTPYTDPVSTTCTNGEVIQMRVYVHNGANAADNDNGTGPSIAHGTKVQVSLPTAAATTIDPTATISATNAATVKDGLTINCGGQTATLSYLTGSASQYSVATNAFTPVNDSIVTTGASIQSESVPGDVWGCWNDRVLVILAVKVVVAPPKPVITSIPPVCTLLTIESTGKAAKIDELDFSNGSTTTNGTTVNGTLTNAIVQFFNGTTLVNTATLTPAEVAALKTSPLNYSFTDTGNYTVKATVNTSLGNVTSNNCEKTFTATTPPVTPPVTPPTTPPTTPPAPTTLVNTGAGSVVGIFAGTSAIAAGAYRWFLGRRLVKG